jgi:hypothetical protein
MTPPREEEWRGSRISATAVSGLEFRLRPADLQNPLFFRRSPPYRDGA